MSIKATVVHFGPPADARGVIFTPGALTETDVPVTENFDYSRVIGRARVHADGSADLELLPGVQIDAGEASIGYRVEESHFEDGLMIVDAVETVCLGVPVKR
jgi:hypothetical protein